VEGHSTLDHRGEFGELGHVGVHFRVTEPEEEGLVADKSGNC
jgi:hypothetical protein